MEFLSTPSARRATYADVSGHFSNAISIHALREEGDCPPQKRHGPTANFYPRPPRGGRRQLKAAGGYRMKFLSTPSARRATGRGSCRCQRPMYFYPRPPRGGRPALPPGLSSPRYISIHALREEGDGAAVRVLALHSQFLSTPSARRATCNVDNLVVGLINFYPRPPRGGRPAMNASIKAIELFLSTPSARRATCDGLHHHLHRTDFYPRPPRGGRRGWS